MNIKYYKILIDNYRPYTITILKQLETIGKPDDKIRYLKSQEIKYLLDVTMNPNLMYASGMVTKGHPHKAGLDKWIELKIKEIENDTLLIKKKIIISYRWQMNPDSELPILYSLMLDEYSLIASETTLEQFKAVFTGQPTQSINPIKWHQDNASELLYFINRLEQTNNIDHNPKRADYQKMTACFVQPDGKPFAANWKQLKQNISINLSQDKQKAIDKLVELF